MSARRVQLRPGLVLELGPQAEPQRPHRALGSGRRLLAADDGAAQAPELTRRAGLLEADEVWRGVVWLSGDVIVPPGVTLTVRAGTLLLMDISRRGEPGGDAATLDIRGGRLLMRGNVSRPVWMTAAAVAPRAGDWRYLQIRDACPWAESLVRGAIIEFGKLGVLCWNASPRIERCLIRQHSWEGIYAEHFAAPRVRETISTHNGYNGMAIEQFNRAQLLDVELSANGTHGLHCDLSYARLERCLLADNGAHGASADNSATLLARRCTFRGNAQHGVGLDSGSPRAQVEGSRLTDNGSAGFNCKPLTELTARDNDVSGNRPIEFHCHLPLGELEIGDNWWGGDDRPTLERVLTGDGPPAPAGQPEACGRFFWPDWGRPLPAPPPAGDRRPRLGAPRALLARAAASCDPGYRPGERGRDPARYVGEDDPGRAIERRMAAGLGLPWSVTHDGEAVWVATLDTDALVRLDPRSGAELARLPAPGPQSWGMTWDGRSLWVNDFARLRVYELDPADGAVRSSFAIPDRSGGAKGLTWTGEALALLGWRSHAIWLLDRDGTPRRRLPCPLLKGGLTWDGEAFWGPCREHILRLAPDGQLLGAIDAASDGTWDLEWAEGLLWATQRTNENWDDPKLFALRVLDASHVSLERFERRRRVLAQFNKRYGRGH